MKKILFFVAICTSLTVKVVAYRLDPWTGPQSDQAVRKAGYAYYLCDPKKANKCFAVFLTSQEDQKVIRKLDIHKGKTVEDALEIVRRDSDSEIVANVLRDFKQFRGINSVQKVLSIFKRRE